MDKYVEDLCDKIDAAMFTGYLFDDEEERTRLREYIDRWLRELERWAENHNEGEE